MPDAAMQSPALAGPGWYLNADDNLRIIVYNALAGVKVTVSGRRLDRVGNLVDVFAWEITPTSDRVASTIIRRLGEGWLLSLHAYASTGAPLIGQTFVTIGIVRGYSGQVDELGTLAAGYVTSKQRIAWPGGPIANSVDGAGAIRKITGANPAAGAEISETVPTGARWQLLQFKLLLTTSGVAGNRQPTLTIDDGTNFYFTSGMHTVTAASVARTMYWMYGMGVFAAATANGFIQGLGNGPMLPAGHRITTSTAAIDVGDQYSAIHYVVREWLEGN